MTCTQITSKVNLEASNLPDISIVAHVATAKADGRAYALVGLAIGAASGGPDLDGVLLHWACVSGQGQDWQQPPAGWHTNPDFSQGAGMNIVLIRASNALVMTAQQILHLRREMIMSL